MRFKQSYSILLDGLGVTAPSVPAMIMPVASITVPEVIDQFIDSINLGRALSTFLVERNRTKNMRKAIAAQKHELDVRNLEERNRTEIIVEEYRQRMSAFLDQQQELLRLETQKIERENQMLVEGVTMERERQSLKLKHLCALLKMYLDHIEQMQKCMADVEHDAERYVKKNRLYFRLEDDCRKKFVYINKCLKELNG